MSGCWGIIPVKALEGAKSRLGPALGPEERVSLSLEMLERVLAAVAAVAELAPLVVSRDPRALALARRAGGETLWDRWEGLNPSLEGAARWCLERGAGALLVLAADLPLLQGEDIAAMMDLGRHSSSVVVAPCRRQEGTNALLVRPPGLIPFAFGPGSFRAHLELASRPGVAVKVYHSPRVALDVDTPEDLEVFRSQAFLAPPLPKAR